MKTFEEEHKELLGWSIPCKLQVDPSAVFRRRSWHPPGSTQQGIARVKHTMCHKI
ncbi:hypothetical protein LQZ18_13965 [Lachnospiraceae bacterium ZAX-1]